MRFTHERSEMDIQVVDIDLTPTHDGGAWPRPAADAFGATRSPYGGERRNGRAAAALPMGHWTLRWKAPLLPAATPRVVLAAGRRIAVQAVLWQVFDDQGHALSNGQSGVGPLLMNEAADSLMFVDRNGMLSVNQLDTAKRRYAALLEGGEEAVYDLMLQTGEEIILAGFRTPHADFEQLDPKARDAPRAVPEALLQKLHIGAKPEVGVSGLVLDASGPILRTAASRLTAARNGGLIAFAVPDALIFADSNLTIRAAYALAGSPVALSIDEADRAHVLHDIGGGGGTLLSVVSPDGARAFSHGVPPGRGLGGPPPIIGFDHVVHLCRDRLLLAIGPGGREVWRATSEGPLGGVLATPSGTLVANEGVALTAYDGEGRRALLFEGAGETLLTPPLLTHEGHLLVAGEHHLFCLTTGA